MKHLNKILNIQVGHYVESHLRVLKYFKVEIEKKLFVEHQRQLLFLQSRKV